MHVVIAWSFDEPERIGETAAIVGPSVLGRGGAQPDDPCARLVFHRRRPASAEPMAPLVAARVSRRQLRLSPREDGTVEVESIGKCTLLADSASTERTIVEAGDVLVLRNALVLLFVRREPTEALVAHPPPNFPFGSADPNGIVGESPVAWRMREELALAAQSPHHVLVRGESGCGKELAARAIHALSSRSRAPLVARNAATFPEGLVDAELFGTAKNYPHAGSPERPGLIGEADGSTLFLDEIGELPLGLQSHLLRVLDADGEYQRLGESRTRRANLRVVAATNRALDSLKHDLAARLLSRIEIPSLDARREDIPLLARHALARLATESPELRARFFDVSEGAASPRVDPRLIEGLLRHTYTHHLRELERLLWLAASTSRESFLELTPEVVAELRPTKRANASDEPTAEQVRAALEKTKGNVTHTANELGLKNRYVLYRLLKKHGIVVDEGS